jgi:predicted NBD/HSP70 family sugar kinase
MGSNISDTFRTAVAAAATGDWHGLTVNHIADGMRSRDPIVISVLQDAAQYLSIAINAIITIVNPPTIILGGSMIQDLPDFAESVLSTSRRHAWAGSWNETDIRIASLGRNGQVLGAVELIRSVVNT